MSKFKIQVGDYVATECMDELEMREVVSMLLKAGVLKGEGYYHANIRWNYIGVNSGGVFYFDEFARLAEDCGRTRKITIDQLRDAAGESEEKPSAWNGEGIPPVGTVCEATWEEGYRHLKCVILSSDHLAYFDGDNWDISAIPGATFRPLQSEEQKQVAELEAMLTTSIASTNKALAQEIYNAGFRKEMRGEQ